MIRRLFGELPAWARQSHPMLRYELGRGAAVSPRGRWLRALGGTLFVLLLFGAGTFLATNGLRQPPGQSLTLSLHNIVYWPVLALQQLIGFVAFTLTANAVSDEVRRQHWDSLRATPDGVALSLRTRWAAAYYRLRPLLALVLVVRLVLVLGILYDLTAFGGRYFDLLLNGIVPDVPLVLGLVLLTLFMTAALLSPLVSLGLEAAFGLLFSVTVRQRTYSILLQIFLLLARLAVVAGLAQGMTQFLNAEIVVQPYPMLLAGGYAALVDGGLAYLNLGLYGDVWAKAPWSVLTAVGLLAFVFVQALLTDWLLARAVQRAEARE